MYKGLILLPCLVLQLVVTHLRYVVWELLSVSGRNQHRRLEEDSLQQWSQLQHYTSTGILLSPGLLSHSCTFSRESYSCFKEIQGLYFIVNKIFHGPETSYKPVYTFLRIFNWLSFPTQKPKRKAINTVLFKQQLSV